MFMRTFNGVSANVDFSWTINKALDDSIPVFRANGKIRAGWREPRNRPAG